MNKIAVIKFRDKKDVRPLPPIPDALVAEMKVLINTKIIAPNLSLFDKLAEAYSFLDRYNAFVATFSVCQKGCSHCCRIDVSVSRLEAEYITLNGGPAIDQGSNFTQGHKGACPFLGKAGECSIYAFRPFNCRTFHTLDDPKYCVDGKESHQVYGAAALGYKVTIYEKLAEWLRVIHDEHHMPYRDIRDWFPPKKSLLGRLIARSEK